MFYSETLLSKTGPLARVWLSANLERKLSKSHILQSNIESSVNAIVDQGTAPMALRLSGQLLLGVVRIYSRKARYLLDDCNEALVKIKMAFRSGNVDLPANQQIPSAGALTLEDKISDPMMPELDPSLLDFQPIHIDFNSKKDDPLNWNSQLLSDPSTIEIGRHAPTRDQRAEFDEEEMNIELDLDIDPDGGSALTLGPKGALPDLADDTLNLERPDDDLALDHGDRASSRVPSLIDDDGRREPDDGPMMVDDDFQLQMNDDTFQAPADPRLHNDLQSPLSSSRSSMARDFDGTRLNEEQESSARQAPHRAKKRKIITEDAETMLTSNQIRSQQADRSAILKPTSFLARDPALLNLMNLQKNGGFASSIMGNERTKGWAPELQGMLSFESVQKASELKRKRDSGVADVSENEGVAADDAGPQIEIPDETFGAIDGGDGGFDFTGRDKSGIHLPADTDAHFGAAGAEQGDQDLDVVGDQFDETTAPLLHPSEHGAVSQGTKHAVHLLRDRFGSAADGSPSKNRKNHIMFQDLLPEQTTSKADATKMFFEILVLATKDAVKVEQSNQEVGSALRVRAKRGLWGSWAETEAGGEIAEQEGAQAVTA